ncbi:Hypothetical predicted protein [Paramuricea clavata]|uniref:Uncharacterized protein n=1 Tax=Paramuricea clavata TaxID=317549 RepID=A0A6S7JRZ8_PARCT|nr:Hypothetical predicted protein [Paramuricea clavata]
MSFEFSRIDICILLFAAIAVSTQGIPTQGMNIKPVPKRQACSIRNCEKVFNKHGDMVTTFNTKNLTKNYFLAKMTAVCDNKTVDICTVQFWKSNNDGICKLVVSATSGRASVTVNNGAKYESCSKILFEFYRSVHCVQSDNDHKEMVEAVGRGHSSPNPTNASSTSEGKRTKDQLPPARSAAPKNTLCTILMLALVFVLF